MSDRALRLLLIERERAARDAASSFDLAERDVSDRARALDLARSTMRSATTDLDDATRTLLDAGPTTASALERDAARRATSRRRVEDAAAAVSHAERSLRVAEVTRDEARSTLAEAVERRRVVADTIDARGLEARRERASREDDEADEAAAARETQNS